MTKNEIEKLKKSIEEAKDTLRKGLIEGEAASQLSSMIYYYEQKIENEEGITNEEI